MGVGKSCRYDGETVNSEDVSHCRVEALLASLLPANFDVKDRVIFTRMGETLERTRPVCSYQNCTLST